MERAPPSRHASSPPPHHAGGGDAAHGRCKCFLLLHGVSKAGNVGTLVRNAAAFGVSEVWVTSGFREKLKLWGSHGSHAHVVFRQFNGFAAAREYARTQGIRLVGVEIDKRSIPVRQMKATCDTVFLLGNEGTGMPKSLSDACDELVYIPQYGTGTASLNVAVACGIVLSCWAEAADYCQSSSTDHKYDVGDGRQRSEGLRFRHGLAWVGEGCDADVRIEREQAAATREAAAADADTDIGSLYTS